MLDTEYTILLRKQNYNQICNAEETSADVFFTLMSRFVESEQPSKLYHFAPRFSYKTAQIWFGRLQSRFFETEQASRLRHFPGCFCYETTHTQYVSLMSRIAEFDQLSK